jgi:amidase
VVNAHLARIDAVNPALNAVVRVLGDQAREATDLADRSLV